MKRSEIITEHYEEIKNAMIEHYRYVVEADGRVQYGIYIWEDGELEYLYEAQGSNSWLEPRRMEPRELFYVCTIEESPSFNLWDYADEGMPEDEAEQETMSEEIIDWLVESYTDNVDEVLDGIISDAEEMERYQE